MLTETQIGVQLTQIIIIDILLSGDNAIVIALAARSLPRRQQRWAIVGGTMGAVGMRIGFAVIIATVMSMPYLRLVGGLLLLWIGVKLLLPEGRGHGERVRERATLGGAIGTIMMADAVMSLDNVIGVAAASKGNVTLLAIGLAISIPLCISGAAIMLKLLARFPLLITAGCGVLGWLAGDIAYNDPALAELTAGIDPVWHYVIAGAGATFVIVVGHVIGRRLARRREALEVSTSYTSSPGS